MLVFQLEFEFALNDGASNRIGRDLHVNNEKKRAKYGEIELLNRVHVELNVQKAHLRRVDLFNKRGHLAQQRSLEPSLAHTRRDLVLVVQQLHRDDRRRDRRHRVDDLFDSRHSLRDIHRRHSCEVERFQRHLRRRLAERLARNRAHGFARLHDRAAILRIDHIEEVRELAMRHVAERQLARATQTQRSAVDWELPSRLGRAEVVVAVVETEENALERGACGDGASEFGDFFEEFLAVDGIAAHGEKTRLVEKLLGHFEDLAGQQNRVGGLGSVGRSGGVGDVRIAKLDDRPGAIEVDGTVVGLHETLR